MLDENNPVALYIQLKVILINMIKAGEWRINDKIPSEFALTEQYKVSRATVRQALKELEHEGYLYRKQGKGTYVTAPKIEQRLSKFYSFSEEIRSMGYMPKTIVLSFTEIEPDTYTQSVMKLKPEEKVFRIKRLRLADNRPFALEVSFVPCRICPSLSREQIEENGLYATMRKAYNIFPESAVETFEAIGIAVEDAEFLECEVAMPALYLERLTYAREVVEMCKSVIPGDRYKYNVVLK